MKVVGTSVATGVAGTASASESDKYSPDSKHEYDIRVNNQSTEEVKPDILFHDIEGLDSKTPQGQPEKRVTPKFSLSRQGTYRSDLDLSSSKYLVRVEVDSGKAENHTWNLPPGGIPVWTELTIRILPNREINISVGER